MGAQPAYEPPEPSRIVRPGLAGCSVSVLYFILKDYEAKRAKLTADYIADMAAIQHAIAETQTELDGR